MPVIDLALLGGLGGSFLCIALASRVSQQTGDAPTKALQQAPAYGLLLACLISTIIAGTQYAGLLHEPFAAWPWLHASPQEDAYGQLRQRNQFGSLMSLGLAAWLYLAQTGWPVRAGRLLAWLSMGFLVTGAVISTSRTGALTWIGIATLALLWPGRAPGSVTRTGGVVALGGFVSLCWLMPAAINRWVAVQSPKISALERLASQPEGLSICESRMTLWRHVLELSWQRPWTGWGWGELDYAHATQAISGERFCGQLGHAHNILLHMAVEWGWPLALGCLLMGLAWVWHRQPWRARTPVALLGWSVIGVIALHSLLEFPLWYGPFQMAFGLGVGWVQAAGKPGPVHATPDAPPSRLGQGLVGVWLISSLLAGWQYHLVSQVYQSAAMRSPACRQDPWQCSGHVVLFHQARDFARLFDPSAEAQGPEWRRELATRVAHYAPESRVLSLLNPPQRPPEVIGPHQ